MKLFLAFLISLPVLAQSGAVVQHLNLAQAHLERENFKEAAAEVEKALALGPIKGACYQLGYAYWKLHRYVEAQRAFEQELKFEPPDPCSLNNLDGPPALLRNDGGNRNHWLSVRCVGDRSNRSAVGARVVLRAGGRQQTREIKAGTSYLSHNDCRVHYGLGTLERVESLEVRWPSGRTDKLENLKANQFLVMEEGKP